MKNILRAILTVVAASLVWTTAARAADEAAEPELYGLYSWAENYVRYADDIQKVGIKWMRVGGWQRDREWADKAALRAARDGVHLAPVLGLSGIGHGKTMPMDEARKAWREAVRTELLRYGPGGSLWKEHADVKALPIRTWQIWNEPNIEFLTPPEGMLRTELYAELLKVASEEIRRLDPGARIIAFNTAGGVPYQGHGVRPDGMWEKLKYIGWRKFIRDVAAEVDTATFDAVGTHPYTQPNSPEAGGVIKGIEMLREVYKDQGFTKPIWFTEVGFPLEYPRDLQVRDERQQACFIARLFAISGAYGVSQVQIMYIEDIIYGPDDSRRSFGFFTAPGEWREQATATEVMIDLVPDPRRDPEILSETDEGVFAYRFRGRGDWPVVMAWNTGEGTTSYQVELESPVATVVDMLGEAGKAEVADGKVTVETSEAPVYVIPAPLEEVRKVLAD